MAITKRMKETTDQSRPQKHPLRQPAVQSRLLLRPASPLGPRPSRAQQLSHLGGITLSPHPHSHGARLRGTAEAWRGPLGGLRSPGLSPLSLLPLISWGNLAPKTVGTWFREQRVQPWHSVGKATQGGK